MRVRFAIAACLLGVAVLSRPAAVAAEPSLRVLRLGAPVVEGAFASLGPSGLVLAGKDPIPLGEIREARFAAPGPAAPKPSRDVVSLRVHLRGGDVLRGSYAGGDSEGLTIRPSDLAEVRVPFDAVLRVETDEGAADPCNEPARTRPPREGTDVVHSRAGDAFPGTLVSGGSSGVVIETGRDRRQTIAWADLVVLHLDEPPLPAPEGLFVEIDTVGGSRLVGTQATGDAKGLAIESRSGLRFAVPVASVAVIRWSGGRFVYACDLAFESSFEQYYGDDLSGYAERFYGGTRADRRPSGCPIRLGGTTYRHGFAVHSKSVVKVPLGKAYRTFESLFGIDDEAVGTDASRGDVTARVLADGRELWSSKGSVRGGEPARVVGPLPVEGVEVLELEVDYGEGLFSVDRAAWADPILVRAR